MADSAPADADRPIDLSTEAELDELVESGGTVLVEFYTDGCGICASMEPVLGNVARETDATVALVNPRDDPPLVDRFDVRGVPLFVLFVDGEPIARKSEGFVPTGELLSWIDSHTA